MRARERAKERKRKKPRRGTTTTTRCDREGRGGRWHCHLTKECRDLTRISLTAAWPEGDGKYEEKKSGGTTTAFIGAKELVKQTVCPFRRFRLPLNGPWAKIIRKDGCLEWLTFHSSRLETCFNRRNVKNDHPCRIFRCFAVQDRAFRNSWKEQRKRNDWPFLYFVLLNPRQFGRFHVTVVGRGGEGRRGEVFFVGRWTKRRKSSSVVLNRCVFGRHRPFGMLMRDYGATTVVIRELFVRLTCATARLKHPLNYPH